MPLERVTRLLHEGAFLQVRRETELLLQEGGLSPKIEAGLLRSLSRACLSLQDYYAAVKYGERAVVMAGEIGDNDIQGRAHFDVGVAYVCVGDTYGAERNLAHFLAMLPSMTDAERFEGPAYFNLAIMYRQRKDWSNAISHLNRAASIFEDRGQGEDLPKAHLDLAWCHLMLNCPQNAKPFIDQIDVYLELHTSDEIANDQMTTKALYYRQMGNISRSTQLCAEVFAPGRRGVTAHHLAEAAWICGENALDVGRLDECTAFTNLALDYAAKDNWPSLMNLACGLRSRLARLLEAKS